MDPKQPSGTDTATMDDMDLPTIFGSTTRELMREVAEEEQNRSKTKPTVESSPSEAEAEEEDEEKEDEIEEDGSKEGSPQKTTEGRMFGGRLFTNMEILVDSYGSKNGYRNVD